MSGPISTRDAPASPVADDPVVCDLTVIDGRPAEVGGFAVHRLLPQRPRRMISSWCFADHMGPASVSSGRGLDIGPHPHIGLQTVTWLLQGAILHRDSLGSEQLIRPGELNLMTAGSGIAHSEETEGVHTGPLHGIQLWVAQPEATRNGVAAFEHHGDLPTVDLVRGVATVLVGTFLGETSPARGDTRHVGVQLDFDKGETVIPLDPAFEYGLIAMDGSVGVGQHRLDPPALGYVGSGRDVLRIEVHEPARALLIGGPPFTDRILMWWNYVARTQEEITEAHQSWTANDGRFGQVASELDSIHTVAPPWS